MSGPASHAVQFYDSDDFLCEAVCDFLLREQEEASRMIAMATPEHLDGIATGLSRRGFDPGAARRRGSLHLLDAREVLSTFMNGGVPDPVRFHRVAPDVLYGTIDGRHARPPLTADRTLSGPDMSDGFGSSDAPDVRGDTPSSGPARNGATPSPSPPKVRAFGEMVDLLWREGNHEGAIRLEKLWNELATRGRFQLLCGYGMDGFGGPTTDLRFRRICGEHDHIRPTERVLLANEGARGRQVALLQQKARTLEGEIERRRSIERSLRRAKGDAERAKAEALEAKREAERANRAKTEFLAVVSHELRTPLNAILGNTQLMVDEVVGETTEHQQSCLDRVDRSTRHLIDMVEQLLCLSRIEGGNATVRRNTVDLVEVATDCADLLQATAATKGLDFEVEAPPGPVRSATDAGKVRQILLNLLGNAVKFTERGGVRLGVAIEEGTVAFEIADTGPGVRPEDIDRIFEPFEQCGPFNPYDHTGTGLGLPVSRRLAELLGGTLTVTSVPGEGSAFTLRLPTARSVPSGGRGH